MELISESLEETNKIAEDFSSNLNVKNGGAVVIGLRGDLGSGKTTFVKSVANFFGLKGTVSSPTFVIEKIYKLDGQKFKNLIHIDAYRLKGGEDLISLGWNEIIKNSENIIFIEWPEMVSEVLPKDIKYINFKFIDENTREIYV